MNPFLSSPAGTVLHQLSPLQAPYAAGLVHPCPGDPLQLQRFDLMQEQQQQQHQQQQQRLLLLHHYQQQLNLQSSLIQASMHQAGQFAVGGGCDVVDANNGGGGGGGTGFACQTATGFGARQLSQPAASRLSNNNSAGLCANSITASILQNIFDQQQSQQQQQQQLTSVQQQSSSIPYLVDATAAYLDGFANKQQIQLQQQQQQQQQQLSANDSLSFVADANAANNVKNNVNNNGNNSNSTSSSLDELDWSVLTSQYGSLQHLLVAN